MKGSSLKVDRLERVTLEVMALQIVTQRLVAVNRVIFIFIMAFDN